MQLVSQLPKEQDRCVMARVEERCHLVIRIAFVKVLELDPQPTIEQECLQAPSLLDLHQQHILSPTMPDLRHILSSHTCQHGCSAARCQMYNKFTASKIQGYAESELRPRAIECLQDAACGAGWLQTVALQREVQ